MTSLAPARLRSHPLAGHLLIPACLVGFGLTLGLVGPFGTYLGMGLPVRLMHFVANVIVIGALVVLVSAWTRRLLFQGQPLPLWAMLAIAVVMAPPGALIVRAQLQLWAPQVLPYVTWGELTLQTLTVNVLMSGLAWTVRTYRRSAAPQRPEAVPVVAPAGPVSDARGGDDALRAKLPVALRHARLIALSAEDHYLRVHTDRGNALILMGLSQAIESLGAERGLRIHRSHWVASDALAGRKRSAAGTALTLDCGLVLPVSRSGRRLLAEAG
ncbi:MAG: LytTR family transcriptional regulator [Rhizobiales bacterium]|nr:LytTR family transcriptional regulator [Hyphomicrobiales bacterium]